MLWDQDGVAQLFRDGGTVGGGDEPLGSPELFLLVPQCDALAAELVPGGVDGLVLSPTQASYMLLGLKHANVRRLMQPLPPAEACGQHMWIGDPSPQAATRFTSNQTN